MDNVIFPLRGGTRIVRRGESESVASGAWLRSHLRDGGREHGGRFCYLFLFYCWGIFFVRICEYGCVWLSDSGMYVCSVVVVVVVAGLPSLQWSRWVFYINLCSSGTCNTCGLFIFANEASSAHCLVKPLKTYLRNFDS